MRRTQRHRSGPAGTGSKDLRSPEGMPFPSTAGEPARTAIERITAED